MKRKIFLASLILLLLSASAFVVWAETPLGPAPQALQALESNDALRVTSDNSWIVFQPADQQPDTGLIVYPGGRVDPRSYAPLAYQIASQGFFVIITPMPLNLAVFDINEASKVIDAFPQIQNWAIAGHSLGGSMAASYAKIHPQNVKALILWASYPASSDDLSQMQFLVASIFATDDGLATPQKIEQSRALLPATTQWSAIEGGNHAQFGWYGAQPGDNPAKIDHLQQQEQIASATIKVLEEIR